MLNLANVARDCQVSRSTIEGYLEIVEDLLLAWRVPPSNKRARRQLRSGGRPAARTFRRSLHATRSSTRAPAATSARTIDSMLACGSAASSFATRDWLEPSAFARSA